MMQRSRPTHEDPHVPRQLPTEGPKLARKVRIIYRVEGRQRHSRRTLSPHSLGDLRRRQVSTEGENVPSLPGRNNRREHRPEFVPMTRGRSDKHERARLMGAQGPEEPVEKPSYNRGGHVLRSRADLPGPPEKTNPRQERKEKIINQLLRTESHGGAVQNPFEAARIHVLHGRDALIEEERTPPT